MKVTKVNISKRRKITTIFLLCYHNNIIFRSSRFGGWAQWEVINGYDMRYRDSITNKWTKMINEDY